MRVFPDVITETVVGDQKISRDEAGFMVDPLQWNDAVADMLADEQGIELTDEHRDILTFMRDYLEEHLVAADARFTFRFLAKRNDISISAARKRFFELFPYGYVQQACKIAGMRQPRAWSTG